MHILLLNYFEGNLLKCFVYLFNEFNSSKQMFSEKYSSLFGVYGFGKDSWPNAAMAELAGAKTNNGACNFAHSLILSGEGLLSSNG